MNVTLSTRLCSGAKKAATKAAIAFALFAGCGGQDNGIQKFRAGQMGTCSYDSNKIIKLTELTQVTDPLSTSGNETQFLVFNVPDLLPNLASSVYFKGADVDFSKNNATALAVIGDSSCKAYIQTSSVWDLSLDKIPQATGDDVAISNGSVATLCHSKYKVCIEFIFDNLKFIIVTNGSWIMSGNVSVRQTTSQ